MNAEFFILGKQIGKSIARLADPDRYQIVGLSCALQIIYRQRRIIQFTSLLFEGLH